MTAAAWGLVALVLTLGSNDYLVHGQLARADALEGKLLPLRALADGADGLYVVFHDRPGWGRAFYLPVDGVDLPTEGPQRLLANALASAGTERFLPGLSVPRLMLSASGYRRGDGLVDLETMALDQAEHYFNALLGARVDTLVAETAWADAVDRRAEALMAEVPADQRRDAYLAAGVDFGSHLLATAHEVGRHVRRKGPKALCRILDHPATLFGAWRRAFEGGQYPGRWTEASAGGATAFAAPGRSRTTGAVLTAADKTWVVERILEMPWAGDPRADFRDLCR